MMIPLIVLLGLAVLPSWPAPLVPLSPGGSALATGGLLGMFVGVAALQSRTAQSRLRNSPERRGEILDVYARGRTRQFLGLMLAQVVALFTLGWGWAVQAAWADADGKPLPGIELVRLMPFFLALLVSWLSYYRADRLAHESRRRPDEVRRPFEGPIAYLIFQARHHLVTLMALPLTVMLLSAVLVRLFPEWAADWRARVGQALVMLATPALAPLVLPWVMNVRRLPPGDLRDRLAVIARRMKFGPCRLYLWNTRGSMANALVAGIIPRTRVVLFSDCLLRDLLPDELEAVFGHEMGHVRHRHMLYYAVFVLMSLALLQALILLLELQFPVLGEWREAHEVWGELPALLVIGGYMIVAFGWLSRRCERQADLYGCRAISCGRPDCCGHDPEQPLPPDLGLRVPPCPTALRTFASALDRVAAINGIDRDRPGFLGSFLHGTIGQRVAFLRAVDRDPGSAWRFERRLRWTRWALLGALAAGMGVLAVLGWGELLMAAL